MVRYRRNLVPGGTFFFTVAMEDRGSDVLVRRIDDSRDAFRHVRSARPFDIDAIVILPEHLHALITLPEGDSDFPTRLRLIKTRFTKSVGEAGSAIKARDGTGRVLWERRFWEHTIRDDRDYARHVDYIHYNAVKHGYVGRAVDWPHSSVHRFIREGILEADWGGGGDDGGDFGEPAGR